MTLAFIQGNGVERDQSRTKLKKSQRIFVNRSLNMGSIASIGFDMDHTIVTYNREAFENLAFRATLTKFIEAGYPEELLQLSFNPDFLIRGLLVDMDRGNILKADGHKYVKIAFHGHRRLPKDLRHKLYNSESFKASSLLSVDTFFALSEVQLFTEIVDYMDRNPDKIKKSYREVYQDLRHFIDLSHADGSIKNSVLKDPEQFIHRDKYLGTTLLSLVEAGKSLFLLTNSNWSYTDAMMRFALDSVLSVDVSWRDLFQYVVVGAGKPGFFTGSQPFYEVMTDSGLLKMHSGPLRQGAIYQGGNANLFQRLTGIRGDQILYVGDHIYGDIVRSKGSMNWRTMLVVEELNAELTKLDSLKDDLEEIRRRVDEREVLDEELQQIRSKISLTTRQAEKARQKGENKKSHYILKEQEKLLERAKEMASALESLDQDIRQRIEARHAAVHPIWGELMKVGLERSRFADQVSAYACVYTARLTNMRFYSPFKRFSSTHDLLPHEL